MLEKFSPGAGFVEAMATVRPETLSEDSVGPVCFVFWGGKMSDSRIEIKGSFFFPLVNLL